MMSSGSHLSTSGSIKDGSFLDRMNDHQLPIKDSAQAQSRTSEMSASFLLCDGLTASAVPMAYERNISKSKATVRSP